MNRSLKLSMLMALALGSSQAMALDLGQIQVKSALGQPLLAEIPLHPDNPAELQNLTVQLASSEDFARAGIAGGRTTIPLHFSVVNAAGGKIIRITSSVAVDDPFLDLLLEVNGGAGKSVREFTILLDPPGAPAAAPVAAARSPSKPSHPVRTRSATPVATPAPAATPRSVQARPSAPVAGNGQYGPVERGQTLSGIARSTAPAGVDVQQMMLALQQANPDAFYRDNINALKSGAVLRVPTPAEAQAMTIAAAAAEVRRQNGDWRAGTPGKPAVVADAATRASTAPNNAPSDTGDRLALVPAKSGGNAGTQGTGKGDASGSHQDLLRAQESLASLQQQSADLKARLKDLADINSRNERLLSLKDNEIAELQAKLAKARKTAGMPAAAIPAQTPETAPVAAASVAKTAQTQLEADLETAKASTTGNASPVPVAAGSSATPAAPVSAASTPAGSVPMANAPAATPAAPVKPVAKPATKPVASAPVVEEPWYMQTWAWAAGAGAIVLLILLALLGRRRKPAAAGTSKAGSSSLADRFGAPAADQDLVSGDDVDQEELLDQLAEHPDDVGLHLELVTLYYSRRDIEHFEAAAEAMHAHVTDPQQDEWQDVLHMGEDLVPGHPLFAPQVDLPASEEAEARSEFNIDDYADADDAPTVVSSMPPLPPGSPKKVSEYSFNFDLTRQVAAEPASPPPAADDITVIAPLVQSPDASTESASSWHFDEPENTDQADDQALGEFNDDPVDTKLDLARAYLDMGDADGARAMLDEVIKEGSQMQQDVARRLLENLH